MNSKKFSPDVQTGYLSDDSTRSYFSRLGFAAFALGIASYIVGSGLVMLAQKMFAQGILPNDRVIGLAASYLINIIAIYCVGTPLFCLITSSLPSIRPFRSKMRFGSFLGGFCVCMSAMYLGNYLSSILMLWFDNIFGIVPSNPIEQLISPNDPAVIIVTLAFMVILAPVLEEFLFRRIICAKLLPLGEGYAIFLSGAIFGLLHGNFYQLPYAFLVGSFLGFIYIKTGKLRYTVIYHMLLNLLGAVIGPWISSLVPLDKIMGILEMGSLEIPTEVLYGFFLLSLYSSLIIGLSVVGIILFFRAKKRKRLKLEQGILPPPRKHRMANLFLNGGVATAIAFFVFYLVMSLKG